MRVKKVTPTAGGKGLNVARILTALKQEVKVTGFVGGFAGSFIKQELVKQKIPHKFAEVSGETRTCINVVDQSSNTHTELLEPGPQVSDKELEKFILLYAELLKDCEIVTLSGSVPQGIETNIYKKLTEMAVEAGKKVILDSSGDYFVQGIKGSPTLVKPNETELEQYVGKKLVSIEDVKEAAQQLLKQGPKIVAVSLGAKGVLVASNSLQEAYWVIPPKIEVVNTVGCGDSMVAAFAMGLSKNWSLEKCAKYAVAVSAAAALSPITGGLVVDEIENIWENTELHRLA